MDRLRYALVTLVAAMLASACTLDVGTLPTPTLTQQATFPPPVAPATSEPPDVTIAVTQVAVTQVAQIAVTQIVATQAPQVAVITTAVPTFNPSCAVPSGWVPYVVVPGDTLGALSILAFTTIADLANANCITNADLIYVGQTLYLPQTPGTFLPTPVVNSATAPTINNILVEPSVVMNGIYTVTSGQVTVRAGNVANAASVTFYSAPTGAASTPTTIGTDTNLTDGATATFEIGTTPLQANVWAIATSATGEQVTSEPILIQANM